MNEPRIIKKYPNRRLYDTEESRYVTVNDVQLLVRGGVDIKVLDSQTGEDITRSILIQIITEQESGGDPLFTTEMLTRMIRFYDEAVHDAFSGYMEQSMRLFGDQQERFAKQVRDAMSGKDVWDMAEMTRRNLKLWQDMQGEFLKAVGFPMPESGGSSDEDDKPKNPKSDD